jgi:serine/threonine protein kinase
MSYAAPEELFGHSELLGPAADIWALGCTIAKVRLGRAPFVDDEENFMKAVERLEKIISPLPNPYRGVWKELGGDFANGESDWENETKPVRYDSLSHEYERALCAQEQGTPHLLKFEMLCGGPLAITQEEANNISEQQHRATGLLPYYPQEETPESVEAERLYYRIPEEEVEQLFELLVSIFKWKPEDRVSLDDLINHPWFGGRVKEDVTVDGISGGPWQGRWDGGHWAWAIVALGLGLCWRGT